MNDPKKASMLQVAVALGAVYLIWGSTYLAIRFAIETIPPFLMAAARYLTAGTLLYAWSRLRGAPRPRPAYWLPALALGALLLLVGNGGVVWAEQRASSGLVALLILTEPLWIVLLVWLRDRRQRPGGRVIAGMLLGFIGLALLVRPSGSGGISPLAVAAVLFASLSWAYGSLYSQRAKLPESPLLSTAMQMLCGGGLLLLAGLATGETAGFAVSQVSTRSLLALAYLVVFGAIIAFTAYVWLLKAAPPVLVSTYAYVNPVVAVFLGWAVADEPITRSTLVAAAVIVVGVVLISRAQGKKGRGEEETAPPAREPEAAVAEEEVCASV
ncbi:MAG TPA: EamA family transporter [Thermoanaerobaculia bacterium]|nr:EamA family transporter [Thermoanaerobaculia bacterium]